MARAFLLCVRRAPIPAGECPFLRCRSGSPVERESIIYSDGWRGYDGLVDLGYQKHFSVQHGNNEFAKKHSHINGIESFWAFPRRAL